MTQHHALFLEAQKQKIKDLIVVNTCNRTELYAWVPDFQNSNKPTL